ncbi:uncharacterized protein LOC125075583 [Vanessa atalanta]|uniref:uncharacterized protein LOC125075583 n=1 Tax=Vanessa atalanta TaxID=42275 RepID=UPI001FCD90D5|nr:uncharacterized protein LOC125075583 [Vanessa atalanta]
MEVPLKKKNYAQKYRKEWESLDEFQTWLKPLPGDDTKAFCSFCKAELLAKLVDLKRHVETKKHKQKMQIISGNQTIKFTAGEKFTNPKSRKAEGMLALYITEHSSVSCIDHLTDLVKLAFPDSKATDDLKMHRTKCTEVIKNVLAPHFVEELIEDIGQQKYRQYSLIIDESTDISTSKQLGIVIRYFSRKLKKVVSSFLSLEPLKTSDAVGIVEALFSCLQKYGLDKNKMVGLGTDNASVMTGINNGVFRILKNDIPNLILNRCTCHSLQLAVSHASEQTLPRNIEFLIRETYNWFSHSAKRKNEYQVIYETINCGESPLKILQVCDTRWLSIEPAVQRILAQWEELTLHFGLVRDRCYTADLLYSMYKDKSNYLYLLFLRSILNDVQIAVKTFESESANPLRLLNVLITLLRSVCNRILLPNVATTDKDFLNIDIDRNLNPVPYMGYLFESESERTSLTSDAVSAIKRRCIEFNVKLAKEIQQRLPTNYTVLELMSRLAPQTILCQGKDNSISELAKELGYNACKIDKILNQWHNICFVQWKNTNDVIKFWLEVDEHRNAAGINVFGELVDLAISALTLPHSNAGIERIFSVMNIVKNKLRNRMAGPLLNAIIFIRNRLKVTDAKCYNYELPQHVIAAIGKNTKYSYKIQPHPTTSSASASASSEVASASVNDDEVIEDITFDNLEL